MGTCYTLAVRCPLDRPRGRSANSLQRLIGANRLRHDTRLAAVNAAINIIDHPDVVSVQLDRVKREHLRTYKGKAKP